MIDIATHMEEKWDIFEKWEQICGVPNNTPYHTGEAVWDVYWKTLYAGSYPYGDAEQTQAAFEKWYSLFREMRLLGESAESRLEEIKNSESSKARKLAAKASIYAEVFWKGSKHAWSVGLNVNKILPARILAFHRTFFKTEKGYVGISSRHVTAGDAVALFEGGKVPLVIHEEEEEGLWRIRGDAYIHGIMNGEEFDASKCSMLSIG